MSRLASLVTPTLSQFDANRYPSEQLEHLIRDGVLHRQIDTQEITHPKYGRVAICQTTTGTWAVPCEDEERPFAPIRVLPEDAWVYSIPAPYVVEHLRRVNGIVGTGAIGIRGMQSVGQKHLDGFGLLELYVYFPLTDPDAFRNECLLLKAADAKRVVVLTPMPAPLSPTDRLLIDGHGVSVISLLPFADEGHLKIDWSVVAVRDTEAQRRDGIFGQRVVVAGVEYKPDLTKREMAFLGIALVNESVPIERVWHRGKDALWKGKFVNDRTNRNKLAQFISGLNAKLARLTPPFPFFFTVPRGEQVIVRTSQSAD